MTDDLGSFTSGSILDHANAAVLATFAPGAIADLLEQGPLRLLDPADEIDGAGAAPIAHALGAVEPPDGLESGVLPVVGPLPRVDHIAQTGMQYLVLPRRLARE